MKLLCHRTREIYDVDDLEEATWIVRSRKLNEFYGLYIYEQEDFEEEYEEEYVEYEEGNEDFIIDEDYVIEEVEEDITRSKLKYALIDGEWRKISYQGDEFDYNNIINKMYRVVYDKVRKSVDKKSVILNYCRNEDERVKTILPGYRRDKTLRENCEMYGRDNNMVISYDDSYKRFVRSCGDSDPISGKNWVDIPSTRYIIHDEIQGLNIQGCRDIYSLLNFFTNKFENHKHYPYFENYQYDLVQPETLERLLTRAKRLGYRFETLEDLLKRLKDYGIEYINTNSEFQREIYPLLYGDEE